MCKELFLENCLKLFSPSSVRVSDVWYGAWERESKREREKKKIYIKANYDK